MLSLPAAVLLVALTSAGSSAEPLQRSPEPPLIVGRRFWNMLPCGGKIRGDAVAQEPMVRESAMRYWLPDLRSPGGDPLAVDAQKLVKLTPSPDPRRPFVIYVSAGRPPFRAMDDYRVDRKVYDEWRREHPNFLGFWTGVEWDNEFVSPLASAQHAVKSWRERGCSETVLTRMQSTIERASVDRDGAVRGLHDCYLALRRYYFDDPARMIFLRAGWCFDHYALEWGAAMSISETTNTGPYRHQVSMFGARGAARQYGRPWQWYIATYYNGYQRNGKCSVNNEPNYLSTTHSSKPGAEEESGPGCGMSVSLNRRDMYLAYLSGASIVEHEDWPRAYCRPAPANPQQWELSPHGEAMREWYDFTRRNPDRGASYAPVALLVPFSQGLPQWGGNPWSNFPTQRPDAMIDAFLYTLVPQSQDVRKGKEGCLSNGPYGDLYDLLVADPPSGPAALAGLGQYRVAILLGGVAIDARLAERLIEYVRQGGTLVVNARQANQHLPDAFLGVKRSAAVRAIDGVVRTAGEESIALAEPYDYQPVELAGARPMWRDAAGAVLATENRYGRGRVVFTAVDCLLPRTRPGKGEGQRISSELTKGKRMPLVEGLMRPLVSESLPVRVTGDVEFGLSRLGDGWWLYLINNRGVTKFTNEPEELDPAETARVVVDLRVLRVRGVRELRSGRELAIDPAKNTVQLDVGPGDIRVLKICEK